MASGWLLLVAAVALGVCLSLAAGKEALSSSADADDDGYPPSKDPVRLDHRGYCAAPSWRRYGQFRLIPKAHGCILPALPNYRVPTNAKHT